MTRVMIDSSESL